jgi:K+:H+ antiporter
VNDLAGWLILAAVLAVLSLGHGPGVETTLGGTAAFVLAMFGLVRRQLLWRVHRRFLGSRRLADGTLALVLATVLGGAWLTGATGTHLIFGAFLVGLAWPRADHRHFTREIQRRLNPITQVVLLPTFFVLPGFSVHLERLDFRGFGILVLILVCAIGSKVAGAATGARAAGFPWRDSVAIGTLMNTRGLMELIVLNIGLSSGVLPSDLYTLLVLMAIVTTVLTTPALRRIGTVSAAAVARAAPTRAGTVTYRRQDATTHGRLPTQLRR